jgi:hypothetical protein
MFLVMKRRSFMQQILGHKKTPVLAEVVLNV